MRALGSLPWPTAPLSVQLWLVEYQLMASLWTPDGERPAPPPPSAAEAARQERSELRDITEQLGDEERAQAEELAREMAEVRDQVARTPAAVVVANHVMGFYELAAIHLSQQPPNFSEATVAIDAMTAVLDMLKGRLGENEQVLRDALSQLQIAFVQLQSRAGAGADAEPG
jgi:hypothetical protein